MAAPGILFVVGCHRQEIRLAVGCHRQEIRLAVGCHRQEIRLVWERPGICLGRKTSGSAWHSFFDGIKLS